MVKRTADVFDRFDFLDEEWALPERLEFEEVVKGDGVGRLDVLDVLSRSPPGRRS